MHENQLELFPEETAHYVRMLNDDGSDPYANQSVEVTSAVSYPEKFLDRDDIFDAIEAELDHAYSKHGMEPWGRYEFYAILKEEVDEAWEDIKSDAPTEQLLKEIVQIASMCIRYLETNDRHRGEHPPIPMRQNV